jgi:hypothetical protein
MWMIVAIVCLAAICTPIAPTIGDRDRKSCEAFPTA